MDMSSSSCSNNHRNDLNDSQNTDKSDKKYYEFYGNIFNQQNMLQDLKRTETYYQSILLNKKDFVNKTVMDVGAGTGILSLFALQAGAKQVYAIEASDSFHLAKKLIKKNDENSQIKLINSKIEEIPNKFPQIYSDISKKIDVLISEPLGIMLVNERMLEKYLLARDMFLHDKGKMFPSSSQLHFIPFSDELLYNEKIQKVDFWKYDNFYGIDISPLYEQALAEKFSQPVIEAYNPNTQ